MKYSTFANRFLLIVRRKPVGERKLKFVVSFAMFVFIKKEGPPNGDPSKGYELIRLATYVDATNTNAAEVLVRVNGTDTSVCGNKRIGL